MVLPCNHTQSTAIQGSSMHGSPVVPGIPMFEGFGRRALAVCEKLLDGVEVWRTFGDVEDRVAVHRGLHARVLDRVPHLHSAEILGDLRHLILCLCQDDEVIISDTFAYDIIMHICTGTTGYTEGQVSWIRGYNTAQKHPSEAMRSRERVLSGSGCTVVWISCLVALPLSANVDRYVIMAGRAG